MPTMTMSAMIRAVPLAAASLLMASCGSETTTPEVQDEDLDARGEVLGGSISDAMLPLDTVTSQSPPRSGGETVASGDEEEEVVEPEAEIIPVPPSAPAPETPAEPEVAEEPPSDG